VGVSDMRVSDQREDLLMTYALGSCLGISIYDPVAFVGGLLHVMLPLSTIDKKKAQEIPAMFVDTGVPRLFLESYMLGAKKERLIVKVAGGACSSGREKDDFFHIGKRNMIILRRLLWKNGVLMQALDVGGNNSRTMTLELATGAVSIRSNGNVRVL
jgi:chemotaxis protein CheD